MSSLVSKGISTIKNDGLKVFVDRTIKYSIVKAKRLIQKKDQEHLKNWKHLKDKYKGKRIFIIGNGPSLNKMPLYLLKNEYTMAFNRFNLMFERLSWKPSFYVVTDDLVIKDMYNEINAEIIPQVKYAFFPDLHPSNVSFKAFIENKENVYWLNTDKSDFRADLPNCGINKTVVNAGMQIAAFMGFSEIYLLGVDMTFEDHKVKKLNSRNWEAAEQDPNHFDPRYFEKGRKYHNPTVHEMLEKFEKADEFFKSLGVQVYNAGIGGKLEVFSRRTFSSLFQYTTDQVDELISATPILLEKNLSFTQIKKTAVEIKDSEFNMLAPVLKTGLEAAQSYIPKLINTHMPVGPYFDQYFFIRKDAILLND